MNFSSQINALIQLSLIDNELVPEEKKMIYTLGKINKIPKVEIDKLFDYHLSNAKHQFPSINNLSDDDKFDYLYNLVQLMKIDKKIYLSEIKFCQDLAIKLGFNKKVINDLSAQIFSDPDIVSDKNIIFNIIKKHKKY